MPIDGCTHSWQHLSSVILPGLMRQMREAIDESTPMRFFADHGPKACAKALLLPADFSGCYVLLEHRKPVYVGISRSVLVRLHQHVVGKTHNTASLTYRLATIASPHKLWRKQAMSDPEFQKVFLSAQNRLRSFDAAFIRIDCPVELYAFELYASMELDTVEWNTFRTH